MARARKEFGAARGLDGQTANVDVWIDAAGADSVLDDFLAHGKIGSRMVAVAVGRQSRSVDLLRMTYAQQELVGSGGYFPEDVRDVMAIWGRAAGTSPRSSRTCSPWSGLPRRSGARATPPPRST
ncbi:MAG: hypothetical protein LIV25_10435 [Olsenella sp.]|jgi:D-arabinose 1-dehydrogenase-like Zn-dependent alcohol dehydrogenase|nr:hypothetical protein [Olsenella sp.]